jgi:hypothetical protein
VRAHRAILKPATAPALTATLEAIFLDARVGLARFGASLHAGPEHIWRYPPVVVAALCELGLLGSRTFDQTLLARFTLDYARLRFDDIWDRLSPVVGIAVVVAAIESGGGAVSLALGLIDDGISGMNAYRVWERARETQDDYRRKPYAPTEF